MIESIVKAFYSIIVNLTGLLYNWICDLFEIFYVLCGIQLFSDSDYNNIVQKVYVILGLVMMFVLIYSLLLAVIDPDKYAKGDNSFPKLIQNVIVSLVIIVVLPTVFNAAFSFQNSLLKYEVIPKIILGDTSDLVKVEGINDPDTISMPKMNVDGVEAPGGRAVAFYTFKTFLTYDMNNDDNKCEDDYETCRDAVTAEKANLTLADVDSAVLASSRDFSHYSMFSGALYDGQLKFDFFISIAAGIFIIYVLLNFCFDMALRVIKLAFYQIIAPIPVICRILPGGKFKDVFSKWVKQVISLFIEVFVRILAITMGVYLIALIADKFNSGIPSLEGLSILDLKKQIVLALLIMSVVMFIKQIPKIIGDLFGLDTGGMKLGLMDKLAAGGGLMAASAIGAGTTAFARNAVNMGKNIKDAKGGKAKLKAVAAGLGSVAAGGASGMVRGLKAGKGAKSVGDVKKSASAAATAAVEKREKRANYIASHGGVGGALLGHITDAAGGVASWAGVGNIEDLKRENAAMDQITSALDAMDDSTNSFIEKELYKNGAKGKIGVGGNTYSLSTLARLQEDYDKAVADGGNTVEKKMKLENEKKNIREFLENQMLVSKDTWDSYSEDDRAKYAALRTKAVEAKGAVYNNAASKAVRTAGIDGSNYSQDSAVSVGENTGFDVLGKTIKRLHGENDVEIATRSQEKKDDKK